MSSTSPGGVKKNFVAFVDTVDTVDTITRAWFLSSSPTYRMIVSSWPSIRTHSLLQRR